MSVMVLDAGKSIICCSTAVCSIANIWHTSTAFWVETHTQASVGASFWIPRPTSKLAASILISPVWMVWGSYL